MPCHWVIYQLDSRGRLGRLWCRRGRARASGARLRGKRGRGCFSGGAARGCGGCLHIAPKDSEDGGDYGQRKEAANNPTGVPRSRGPSFRRQTRPTPIPVIFRIGSAVGKSNFTTGEPISPAYAAVCQTPAASLRVRLTKIGAQIPTDAMQVFRKTQRSREGRAGISATAAAINELNRSTGRQDCTPTHNCTISARDGAAQITAPFRPGARAIST